MQYVWIHFKGFILFSSSGFWGHLLHPRPKTLFLFSFTLILEQKTCSSYVVCLFVCLFVRSFVRSFVRLFVCLFVFFQKKRHENGGNKNTGLQVGVESSQPTTITCSNQGQYLMRTRILEVCHHGWLRLGVAAYQKPGEGSREGPLRVA